VVQPKHPGSTPVVRTRLPPSGAGALACVRMEINHAPSLLSAEPVEELMLRLRWQPNGLLLWGRHRHHCGLFLDCEALVCERLTHRELLEVVELQILDVGPHSTSRLQPR
jgi:hypothetical protein